MQIIINGDAFAVGTSSLSRSLRREYKYRVTTEDGVEHAELRARYLDFSLALGNVDAAEYDRLMALLYAADELCVELPSGRNEKAVYFGRFEGIADELITQDENESFWDNLTLSFSGTRPRREVEA